MIKIFKAINNFFILALLISCFFTTVSAGELSIGLGWPFISAKCDFSRFAGEGKFATGEGINVYAGRGYWNFSSSDKLKLFTGLEGGYIKFDTLDTKGTGWEGAVFLGGEYFITNRLSFAMDFSPTFIALNSDDIKVDGVEFVCNLAVYYRLFGNRDSSATPQNDSRTEVAAPTETSQKQTNYISVKVTDAKGNPLLKTTVKISQNQQEIAKVPTDEMGQMSQNDLPIGKYTVKAWKQGYIAEEKVAEVSADTPAELNFSLKKK